MEENTININHFEINSENFFYFQLTITHAYVSTYESKASFCNFMATVTMRFSIEVISKRLGSLVLND